MMRLRKAPLSLAVFFMMLLGSAGVSAQSADVVPYAPADAVRLLLVSPDGTKVAGTPDLQGDTLCVYSVPAGDQLACADLDARDIHMNIMDLGWSPDSSTIVFAERPLITFVDGDLWTMDAATGELTNITDDDFLGDLPFFKPEHLDHPVYADVIPRFSPDGTSIAFSRTTFTGSAEPAPSELWVYDLASGEARSVAWVTDDEPGALYFNLAWSPDGATIYASLFHADQKNAENGIWAFDVATGDKEQVGHATSAFQGAAPAVMAVSPLGDQLTVYYPAVLGAYGSQWAGYGLLSLDTEEIVPIEAPASLGVDAMAGAVMAPGFTPDGSSLMYLVRSIKADARGALVLRDLATGEEQIFILPDDAEPTINDYRDGTVLGVDGNAIVLTTINTADLVAINDPSLLIAPTSAIPETAATPVADSGETRVVSGLYVKLYAAPTTEAPVVFVFTSGDEVEQIGEPVEANGETWVPVRDPASGTIGYLLAGDLT